VGCCGGEHGAMGGWFHIQVVERAGSGAVKAILATMDGGAIRRLHPVWYAVQRRLGGSDKPGIYAMLQIDHDMAGDASN
jgi:hypothetical protein